MLVEEGAFDDVDFAFQLHLGAENNAHVVTLAMDSLEFTFHGKQLMQLPIRIWESMPWMRSI